MQNHRSARYVVNLPSRYSLKRYKKINTVSLEKSPKFLPWTFFLNWICCCFLEAENAPKIKVEGRSSGFLSPLVDFFLATGGIWRQSGTFETACRYWHVWKTFAKISMTLVFFLRVPFGREKERNGMSWTKKWRQDPSLPPPPTGLGNSFEAASSALIDRRRFKFNPRSWWWFLYSKVWYFCANMTFPVHENNFS